MNPRLPSLLMPPLVPLGCLTLPRDVPLLEDRTLSYDYRNAVHSAAPRSPARPSAEGLADEPGTSPVMAICPCRTPR
jgi:hypothetical protein